MTHEAAPPSPAPEPVTPDEVEEADEESFPASDPPSTWSGGPSPSPASAGPLSGGP